MKIDDFLKKEMNWTDRDLEYRPVIGYWKVTELLQKWGEKQLLLHDVVGRSEQLKCRCIKDPFGSGTVLRCCDDCAKSNKF